MDGMIDIDGISIPFEFVKKPLIRNTYLRFRGEKLVIVARNRRSFDQAMGKHRRWISKHYSQIRSTIKLFDSNSVFYNSRRYCVSYVESASRPRADISEDRLSIYASSLESANRYLDGMIKRDSERVSMELACDKASLLGFNFKSIKVRRYRKWGACRSDRSITVNYCISMLPRELQDYIISHEVAHLKEMNHSREFWSTVASLCPDYRDLKKRLGSYDNSRRDVILRQK